MSSGVLTNRTRRSTSSFRSHVIVAPEWFAKLAPASEEEEDMLDLAFGLTQTSRLSCQIRMSKELDGITVTLPAATRNMMVESK